jgi:hypothetical protein
MSTGNRTVTTAVDPAIAQAAAAAAAAQAAAAAAAAAAAQAAAAQATSGILVVGGPAKLAYSQDGVNYTVSNSASNIFSANLNAQVHFIVHNGSQWLAGGQSQSGAKLAISADGINWTTVSSMNNYGGTNASFDYAIWNGDKWIMQCMNIVKNYITEFFEDKYYHTEITEKISHYFI